MSTWEQVFKVRYNGWEENSHSVKRKIEAVANVEGVDVVGMARKVEPLPTQPGTMILADVEWTKDRGGSARGVTLVRTDKTGGGKWLSVLCIEGRWRWFYDNEIVNWEVQR